MADYQHGSTTLRPRPEGPDDALEPPALAARKRLHELTQAVALVVGMVELLPLHAAGSPERAAIERELAVAAGMLTARTERLRDALLASEPGRTPA
jgi:hypothetical protein